jgi:hypothetical protein
MTGHWQIVVILAPGLVSMLEQFYAYQTRKRKAQ